MTSRDPVPGPESHAGIEPIASPWPDDLQVWRVRLDAYPADGDRSNLAADEWARVARLPRDEDRRRLQAARDALRRILGACTGRDPAALEFSTGEFGKPSLIGHDEIHFNLSHSACHCLIAVSAHRAVGVDVESVSIVRNIDALARRHFTAREREQLANAEPAARQRAFLVGWTRKEACMKALGVGLSLGPSRIDAGCDDSSRDVSIEVHGKRATMTLASLALDEEAVGAVALVSLDQAGKVRRRFT